MNPTKRLKAKKASKIFLKPTILSPL